MDALNSHILEPFEKKKLQKNMYIYSSFDDESMDGENVRKFNAFTNKMHLVQWIFPRAVNYIPLFYHFETAPFFFIDFKLNFLSTPNSICEIGISFLLMPLLSFDFSLNIDAMHGIYAYNQAIENMKPIMLVIIIHCVYQNLWVRVTLIRFINSKKCK